MFAFGVYLKLIDIYHEIYNTGLEYAIKPQSSYILLKYKLNKTHCSNINTPWDQQYQYDKNDGSDVDHKPPKITDQITFNIYSN